MKFSKAERDFLGFSPRKPRPRKPGGGKRATLYKRLVAAWVKQYRSEGDPTAVSNAIHEAGMGLINLGFESDVDKAMNEALAKANAPKGSPRMKKTASGYVPCACRDCMEIAISSGGKAFCSGCRDAGCPGYQGQPGMSQECQRPDAYGG